MGQVSVLCAQSVDSAVDNAYRGAGIFKKLAVKAVAQASKEGVAIISAFANEIAYKGRVRMGYRPMFMIPKMFRVFRTGSRARKVSFLLGARLTFESSGN